MLFTVFRDMNPSKQLMFTGFVVVVVFLFTQLVAALLALPLFGFDKVAQIVGGIDFSDPESLYLLKYLQVFQSFGLFIVPSLIVAFLFDPDGLSYLSLRKWPTGSGILFVVLLIFIVNPFINFTGAVNAEMHFPEWMSGIESWMRNAEDTAEKLTEAFLKANHAGTLLFNLFMIAVLPALGEELLFRGVIQQIFSRMTHNHHWGIWLSAALFSALHLQFYGFIPRMLLGGMFGYLLVWSGSLWLPVLAHFINNAAAVIIIYLIDNQIVSSKIEEFGSGTDQWYIALFSLLLGIIILISIKRQAVSISSTDGSPRPDY